MSLNPHDNHPPSRKMGFLEKHCVYNNNRYQGTTNCIALLKVHGVIDFSIFKKAWEILFQRQPMLRATWREAEGEYFFDFNAKFSDIPIKHIVADDFAVADEEYSRNIGKFMDLTHYYWRATLVTMPGSSCIILGISHGISDGLSISWLLGDLLRIIIELKAEGKPETASLPLAPAIDDILDRSQFITPSQNVPVEVPAIPFYENSTVAEARSENIFRMLSPAQQKNLLENSRKHQVSITSVLCAALALSAQECGHELAKEIIQMAIAFNLRKSLTQKIPERLLAFMRIWVLLI